MSAPRFYVPQLAQLASGCLDDAEARHAASVLRLSVDDRLELFDGRGREAEGRIVAISRGSLQFEVLQWLDRDCELVHRLTLAIALPKGDRQKTLVDAATELGVSSLIPLRTERSVAQPTDNALQRLARAVIEASKQCGRNRLMEIMEPRTIAELNTRASLFDGEVAPVLPPLRCVAHPYDDAGRRKPLAQLLSGARRAVEIAVGPEGGFTEQEVVQLVADGWQAVDLGPTILRVEIAAITAVAQIAAWLHRTPA